MSIDVGYNFRSSVGFVTDGANQYFVDNISYPTTLGGLSVGWSVGVSLRDRNSGIDVRLAGIHFVTGSSDNFRIDLPSTGDYDIWLAAGDASSQIGTGWDLLDNTTVFQSISNSNNASGDFRDATDTNYSTANWPGSNTKITRTFGSTIFKLKVRDLTFNGLAAIAHIRVATAASAGATMAAGQYYSQHAMTGR